ncbi:uncharacterized protein [Pyxicephalus adspersus]|uniref:uncharacterized protein n=1 Tax=Pyxicephalus adspersus TaxID=30357 RepID=UPI003B5C03C7
MGNSVSRPGCLGERGKKSERFLKECCMKKESVIDFQSVRNNVEPSAPQPDKKPNELVFEKELNLSPTSSKTHEPLPKQNNADANVPKAAIMGGTPRSTPDHIGNMWTPQRGTLQRASGGSWSWKPLASREVTEVTEVTETIVTEIVEVTQFPSGEKGGEPIVTRTVKVMTDYGGELTEVPNSQAAQADPYSRVTQWDAYNKTHALALPELPETLDTIQGWVLEMEDL